MRKSSFNSSRSVALFECVSGQCLPVILLLEPGLQASSVVLRTVLCIQAKQANNNQHFDLPFKDLQST